MLALTGAAAGAALAVAAPLAASAHVHVDPGTAPAGTTTTLTFAFCARLRRLAHDRRRDRHPRRRRQRDPRRRRAAGRSRASSAPTAARHGSPSRATRRSSPGSRRPSASTCCSTRTPPNTDVAFPVTQQCVDGATAWTEVAADGEDAEDLDAPAPVGRGRRRRGRGRSRPRRGRRARRRPTRTHAAAGGASTSADPVARWLAGGALALGAAALVVALGPRPRAPAPDAAGRGWPRGVRPPLSTAHCRPGGRRADERMDAPCRPTRPRTCPPCSARTRPPSTRSTTSPPDSASTVRGDTAGVTLTGLTLATADLRPGDVFVAIRGVNRHGAEFAADRRREGRGRGRDGCRGRRPRRRRAGCPSSSSTTRAACSATSRRGSTAPGATTTCRSCSRRPGPTARRASRTCSRGSSASSASSTGLSSTAERHIAGQVIVSRLTTPEAYEMHALLALMRERGVEAVAVEVSAQALSRRRVDGIVFDVAGFTNLTHDHLDDYADMREYFEAKLPLFRPDRARRAVVCLDSAPGAEVVARSEVPTVTVGTPAIAADPDAAAAADWVVEILDERPDGTEFRLAVARRPHAHDRRAGHRTPHGRQRRPRDRHDPRGRLRVGAPRRRARRRAHRRLPARPHRARLGRARTRRLRRLRPLPRRVREDARRRPPRDAGQGRHALRRRRRPRRDEAPRHGPRRRSRAATSW